MHFIDVLAIIEFFGGISMLVAGLEKMGAEGVSAGAIEKWRERKTISTRGLLILEDYAT